MYIKMKEDKQGAEQGIYVKLYKKGQEYHVSDILGVALIGCKAAEKATPPKAKKEDKKESKGKK